MSQSETKTIAPIIAVASVDKTRQFYVENLGFDHVRGMLGKDGQLDFCTVARDGARIMFARAPGGGSDARAAGTRQPVGIYLEVVDVEQYFGQLSEQKGVKVTEPLTTQWWGDRTFKALDPNGYELWFYQTVDTPKPPQGLKIV